MTPAEAPARELRDLYDATESAGLAPNVVLDLGETWSFAYYTGMLFQVLAEGPGEPVGSGGRYDRLFDRFAGSRPAAGFAMDLGNLIWALGRSGMCPTSRARVLVTSLSGGDADSLLSELRRRGVACAGGAADGALGDTPAGRSSRQ